MLLRYLSSLLFLTSAFAYGSNNLDIIKCGFGTHSLKVSHLTGNNDTYITLANRARGTIDIYSPKAEAEVNEKDLLDSNFIDYAENWTLNSFPVDIEIYALEILDINHDGLEDLIYHGSPSGLYIRLQKEGLKYAPAREIDLPEGLMDQYSLLCRKNGSDSEIVVMHENYRSHLYIDKNLKLTDKLTYPHPSYLKDSFKWMHWGNICGQNGLWVHTHNNNYPLVSYKQLEARQYDYPQRIKIPQTRLIIPGNFKSTKQQNFLHIRSEKGQLSELEWAEKPQAPHNPFTFHQRTIPYHHSQSRAYSFLSHDMNGDGHSDLLVAHREAALLELFCSTEKSIQPGKTWPSFRHIDYMNVEGNQLNVYSRTENLLGQSHYTKGEMSFPKLVHHNEELVTLLKRPQQKGYLKLFSQEGQLFTSINSKKLPISLEEPWPEKGIALELKKAEYPELILQIPYQGIKIFSWDSTKESYEDLADTMPFLKSKQLEDLSLNSLSPLPKGDRYELSVSEGSLIRIYSLDPYEIITQINMPEAGSTSSLHRYIDINGSGKNELVSYDSKRKVCDIFSLNNKGTFEKSCTIPLNGSDIYDIIPFSHKGHSKKDLIFVGKGEMQWLQNNSHQSSLSVNLTPLKYRDADWQYSYGIDSAPFEGNGLDSAFTFDSKKHYIEIYSFMKEKWQRKYSFPIFEKRFFRQNKNFQGEVRDMKCHTMSQGSKPSIFLLIHDRILIYQR
ncbi:MAG: hypothetical protein HQL32_03895 [Planctomycetes bacterium]|nr:hypothetical protein [Planctomycetota bacterium]